MGEGKSSLGVILWKFLIFGNLSLDDSYKLDSYKKKVCRNFETPPPTLPVDSADESIKQKTSLILKTMQLWKVSKFFYENVDMLVVVSYKKEV